MQKRGDCSQVEPSEIGSGVEIQGDSIFWLRIPLMVAMTPTSTMLFVPRRILYFGRILASTKPSGFVQSNAPKTAASDAKSPEFLRIVNSPHCAHSYKAKN